MSTDCAGAVLCDLNLLNKRRVFSAANNIIVIPIEAQGGMFLYNMCIAVPTNALLYYATCSKKLSYAIYVSKSCMELPLDLHDYLIVSL